MLQNKVQLSSKFSQVCTLPGKVFVLGEYAVLKDLPALIAAVGPRFEMTTRLASQEASRWSVSDGDFHPQSPVARLMDYARNLNAPELDFQFDDPHEGAGGFGASTAQFAAAYEAYARLFGWERNWLCAWKLYRELTHQPGHALPPSGADLVAQWNGGVTLFDPARRTVQDLGTSIDWSNLLVFSATGQTGRKVATHEHLKVIRGSRLLESDSHILRQLADALDRGVSATRAGCLEELGDAMDRYAAVLQHAGLEAEATYRDRLVLRELSGVLGVKGAGASQADAVLVLMAPGAPRDRVIETAIQRKLRLVCDGLELQTGIKCLN